MLKTARELLNELGAAIRARRISRNLTQAEAALRAGIGVRTWRRLESDGQATTEHLVNAAIALRCEAQVLGLFPNQAARSMDELLKQQRKAAPPKRAARARKAKRT